MMITFLITLFALFSNVQAYESAPCTSGRSALGAGYHWEYLATLTDVTDKTSGTGASTFNAKKSEDGQINLDLKVNIPNDFGSTYAPIYIEMLDGVDSTSYRVQILLEDMFETNGKDPEFFLSSKSTCTATGKKFGVWAEKVRGVIVYKLAAN